MSSDSEESLPGNVLWLRWQVRILGVLVVAVSVLNAVQLVASHRKGSPGLIKATRFVLVDADGNPIASLHEERGSPVLELDGGGATATLRAGKAGAELRLEDKQEPDISVAVQYLTAVPSHDLAPYGSFVVDDRQWGPLALLYGSNATTYLDLRADRVAVHQYEATRTDPSVTLETTPAVGNALGVSRLSLDRPEFGRASLAVGGSEEGAFLPPSLVLHDASGHFRQVTPAVAPGD